MAVLSILLAAISAGVWGTGDFCGGKATQRSNPVAVTVLSQLLGLPVLVVCVLTLGRGSPTGADVGYGTLAGIAGFGGILLLYRGLAQGSMAIFAPISAVTAALVPLIVGLVTQRAPSHLALIGAGCAIGAIGLVSISGGVGGDQPVTVRLIGLALASGVMFGLFFAVLGLVGKHAGVWPMVGVRLGSLAVGLAVVLATRTPLVMRGPALRFTGLAGVFDVGANVLYVLAVSGGGTLTIVAPIAALYPVSTVLLALGVDRERIRPVQLAGLGLAVTALVLVAT